MANRLSNLEIDEISLVYKGANQHAKVTIAKSFDGEEESEMTDYFDADGDLVDPESLEVGDQVEDEDGNVFEVTEADDDDDDDDTEEVGKASLKLSRRELAAASKARRTARNVSGGVRDRVTYARRRAGEQLSPAVNRNRAGEALGRAGRAASGAGIAGAMGARGAKSAVGGHLSRNKTAYMVGGAGGLGYAGGHIDQYSYRKAKEGRVKKSFSEDLQVELSKALTDDDRDAVIAKAFAAMEDLQAQADESYEIAKAEQEARQFAECVEIAKSYDLPVEDEELADVIKACSELLTEEQNEVIAKCLSYASEANGLLDEIGAEGNGYNTGIMSQIDEIARGHVSKNNGENTADYVSKMFEENPDLYDEYINENR